MPPQARRGAHDGSGRGRARSAARGDTAVQANPACIGRTGDPGRCSQARDRSGETVAHERAHVLDRPRPWRCVRAAVPRSAPHQARMAAAARTRRKADKSIERKGIKAKGHVLGTRNATKKIREEAKLEGCDVIVMGADPDRNRVTGNLLWSQEPQRVRRERRFPCFLVVEDRRSGQRAPGRPCSRASLIASSSDSRPSSSRTQAPSAPRSAPAAGAACWGG